MRVPVHGAVLGEREDELLQQVIANRWYTEGPLCHEFEKRLRDFTGKREIVLTNSGSSANLLALSALTADELGERRIKPGDEVITTALNFPTTLNPILQIGAVPVFVDVDLPGMEPNKWALIGDAINSKTKAVIYAHTLGYPFQYAASLAIYCHYHGIWLIEDCCDALGSPGIMKGDLSTLSFYPAHQITTGEGGSVLTDSPKLAKLVRSFRDWGKDCWCPPGKDNTCGRRFDGEIDHKYSFSHIGYNLKMGEFAGALGAAQMERLPEFVEKRANRHYYLYDELCDLGEYFILPPGNPDVSWFGFCLICKPPVSRNAITRYLEECGVQTRIVFGGNLLRQRAYLNMRCRIIGDLANTNNVHDNAFWVGCWPGLTIEQLDYTVECIREYVKGL